MSRRTARPRPRAASKPTTSRTRLLLVAGLLAVVGLSVLAFGLKSLGSRPDDLAEKATPAVEAPLASESESSSASIEVPDVTGASLKEASIVLQAAGLVVSASGATDTAKVTGQDPVAGTIAAAGSRVTLLTNEATSSADSPAGQAKATRRMVVCIDPGHQRRSNDSPEPIGPGSKKTKPKVSAGTTGVSTDLPEYEVALQIAMNLKERLEAQGVKVVMTRTTNDVDLSNSERAKIANDAHADLFLRIHCDGSPQSSTTGISTLYPTKNTWTKPISARSKEAATAVQRSVVGSTGAVDRGAVGRSDLSGFNYAKVPSIPVECGFMSNSVEDRLLASPHYQDKLAEGIAAGAISWLSSTTSD